MVKHMGITQDDTQVGFTAGYIAGAFMFGRIPGRCVLRSAAHRGVHGNECQTHGRQHLLTCAPRSLLAGYCADRFGRKPVIIVGLLDVMIMSILFGMSESLAMAIASRAIMGVFNGIVVACKTIIPELFPKEAQAAAMGTVGAVRACMVALRLARARR